MPKKRLVSGVIDPITIIGVLFLIITLGVGTYVATNKNISLDINERASCMSGCIGSGNGTGECNAICNPNNNQNTRNVVEQAPEIECWSDSECAGDEVCGGGRCRPNPNNNTPPQNTPPVVDTPPVVTPTQPTVKDACDANGVSYDDNSIIVGGTGSGSNRYAKCVNGRWEDCPTCTISQLTEVPVYLLEQYNQAVGDILYQQEIIEQSAPKPSNQTQTPNVSQDVHSCEARGGQYNTYLGSCDLRTKQQIEEDKRICSFDGGVWNTYTDACDLQFIEQNAESLVNQVNQIRESRQNGEKRCSGSMVESWNQNTNTWDQEYCSNGCVNGSCIAIVQSGIEVNRDDDGVNRNLYTIYRGDDNSVLTSASTPIDINYSTVDNGYFKEITTTITNAETNEILNAVTRSIGSNIFGDYEVYNFADCNRDDLTAEQTQRCNNQLSEMFTVPIIGQMFNRYTNAYNPQNINYTGNQFFGYNTYTPTNEQIASSTALGTTITTAGALLGTSGGFVYGLAGGTGALALTGTQAINAGMTAFTVNQYGSTVDICLTAPDSAECRNSKYWSAISSLNILSTTVTSALELSKFANLAKGLNAAVNLENVYFDTQDISQSCGDGEYASGFGCVAAWGGLVFDVGQGAVDLRIVDSIAGSFRDINSLSGELGAWPIANTDLQNLTSINDQAPTSAKAYNNQVVTDNLNQPDVINVTPDALDTYRTPEDPRRIAGLPPSGDTNQFSIQSLAIDPDPMSQAMGVTPNNPVTIESLMAHNDFDRLPQADFGNDPYIPLPNSPILDALGDTLARVVNGFQESTGFNPSFGNTGVEPLRIAGETRPIVYNVFDGSGTVRFNPDEPNSPIFDINVSRDGVFTIRSDDNLAFEGHTQTNIEVGRNPLQINGKYVKPGETIAIKLGDTITLSDNTKIKWIEGSPKSPGFEVITTQKYGILGDTREVVLNKLSNQENTFFHPGDEVYSPSSGQKFRIPETSIDGEQVFLQVVIFDSQKQLGYAAPIPLQKTNILPNITSSYRIEFGTMEGDTFRPLNNNEAIFVSTTTDQLLTTHNPGLIERVFDNILTAFLLNPRSLAYKASQAYINSVGAFGESGGGRFNIQIKSIGNTPSTPLTTRIGDWVGQIFDPLATRLGLDIRTENLRFTDQAIEGRLSDQAINNRRIPPEWVQRIISSDGDWFPISLLPETSPYRVLINEVADQITLGTKEVDNFEDTIRIVERPSFIQDEINRSYEQTSGNHVSGYIVEGEGKDYKFADTSAAKIVEAKIITNSTNETNILDIGAAKGGFIKDIQQKHPQVKVFGLTANDYRSADNPLTNVDYRIGNAENITNIYPENSFDIIVSSVTVRHFVDPLGALTEAYRLLKVGGIMLIDSFEIPGISMYGDQLINFLKQNGYEIVANFELTENVTRNKFIPNEVDFFVIKKTANRQELRLPIDYVGLDDNGHAIYKLTQELPQTEIELPKEVSDLFLVKNKYLSNPSYNIVDFDRTYSNGHDGYNYWKSTYENTKKSQVEYFRTLGATDEEIRELEEIQAQIERAVKTYDEYKKSIINLKTSEIENLAGKPNWFQRNVLYPPVRVWYEVKNWWDESILNRKNWTLPGGSPAIDPVAVGRSISNTPEINRFHPTEMSTTVTDGVDLRKQITIGEKSNLSAVDFSRLLMTPQVKKVELVTFDQNGKQIIRTYIPGETLMLIDENGKRSFLKNTSPPTIEFGNILSKNNGFIRVTTSDTSLSSQLKYGFGSKLDAIIEISLDDPDGWKYVVSKFNSTITTLNKRISNSWNYSPLNPFNVNKQLKKIDLSQSDFLPSSSFKESLTSEELKILNLIENSGIEVFMLPANKYDRMNSKLTYIGHSPLTPSSIARAGFPHKNAVTFTSKLITYGTEPTLSHMLIHEYGHLKGPQISVTFIDKLIGIKPVINEVLTENYVYVWAVRNNLSEKIIRGAFDSKILMNDYTYLSQLYRERAEDRKLYREAFSDFVGFTKIKTLWNNFVESDWNPRNWGGGGSPAVDPVAESNNFDDLIKQAEDSILPEYDEAMTHYQYNSPYQPGSASIAPINELETNIMLDIKKTDSNSPMPLRELIVNDRIRSNLVDSIIQTDNLDEAIRILEANNVKVHLVPRSEISGASGWAKDTKNMYIADDVATNWSTAKGTVAHESTHIVMGHEKDIAFIKYTENHRNLAVSEALKKVGEEDWAFANGIRADLYELQNNKNLTPDQIATIRQHIKLSIENYNWVVFGDVLPKRNTLPPSAGFLDEVKNERNTQGQTLVEFSTIMPVVLAVPTVGLYYIDQYFDWGITDTVLNSISESLEDNSKQVNITDPVYNTINFWLNSAAIVYGLNNDKELSEISIPNPNQRPYDEIIQEAIDNYTKNNPDSDVYYESNPQALSLTDIFKQLFSRDSLDIIYSTVTQSEYKKLALSGKIMSLTNNLLTKRNPFIASVTGAAGNIGLFSKDGGFFQPTYLDNEINELVILIEQEVQTTGHPVSHSFVIEYFLKESNGDLAQAILDSSNFEELLVRSLDDKFVNEPYIWIQDHIVDEYSPLLPYQTLPKQEARLENTNIYYDYSLPNRLGEIYHAASITALLHYLPPEIIRGMVISEYLSYGNKHGLIKLSADLEVLRQLDNINDLLESYE